MRAKDGSEITNLGDGRSERRYSGNLERFRDGKLHGSPAITYTTGTEADYDMGQFVAIRWAGKSKTGSDVG